MLWAGREHEYEGTADDVLPFVRCASCGLVRLSPRPEVSELSRIYPSDYYAYNLLSTDPSKGERPSGFTDRLKMRMYQRRVVGQIARLGGTGKLRVLDIGCADGRLLDWYRASSEGHRLETHGIEMNESAADIARTRGHRVVTGRFEVDRQLEEGSFHLILAAHVIEHVEDPRGFARRASDLLAPGGLLVIATPNWDSADARRLRGHWGGNHFPRHWTLYDEGTMRDLAEFADLRLERVEYQPNPIFWVWSCHSWLRDKLRKRHWADRAFPPVDIFAPSTQSFLLLSGFTLLDIALRAVTGKTASMSVELRKPQVD